MKTITVDYIIFYKLKKKTLTDIHNSWQIISVVESGAFTRYCKVIEHAIY